jgi:hypothetical protein
MDLITAEHVRALSDAPEGAALVIAEGQAKVVPGPATDKDGYLVIGRQDLQGMLGSDGADEHGFDELARRLNSAVIEQGG